MTVPKLSGLNCPNCGAAIELRTFGQAITVVCQSCKTILDAKDPNVAILKQAPNVETLIPLGSRGQFEGVKFEAIGFQIRTENDPDDGPDSWQEYLLYNPFNGYRYLTEYNRHWNFVRIAHSVPELISNTEVKLAGAPYRLYARSVAQTTYVIGEFPWVIRVGDQADVADFIAAPRILSSETTPEETVWSIGGYMTGAEVWQAFGLPGAAPPARGTAANQPSPFVSQPGMWSAAWKLAVAALLVALYFFATGGKQVYRQSVTLGSNALVTPAFDVGGHTSNLQLQAHNHGEQSFYLHYGLVDLASGQAVSFARDIGSTDSATIPDVKPGRYAVRMESEPAGAQFDLVVKRDVPSVFIPAIIFLLLLLPPGLQTFRGGSFERDRWLGSSR